MKKFNKILKDRTSYNKDENRIKNQIDFEKYNKKRSGVSFMKSASIGVGVCFLIISGVMIAHFLPTSSISSSTSEMNEPITTTTHVTKLNAETLLGLASVKEFEHHNVRGLNSDDSTGGANESDTSGNDNDSETTNEDVTHYEYPFNYIKIHSAFSFEIEIPADTEEDEVDIIRRNCGLGRLEVIVADFSTYLTDDENDRNDNGILDDNFAVVTDTLITIKGSEGLYTILNNSGSYRYVTDNDGVFHVVSTEVFSSHKTITNDSIGKDFVGPYYGILLYKNPLGESSVSFAKSENGIVDYDDFENTAKYSFDLNMTKEVSRDTIYSIYDLASLPQSTIRGVLIDINKDEMYLEMRESDEAMITNEYFIHIDENTEYEEKTIALNDLWAILERAETIEVQYDYLYEGYKPHNVYANSIAVEGGNAA